MELEDLDFSYFLEDKRFYRIQYSFDVLSNRDYDEVSKEARKILEKFNSIITGFYGDEVLTKETGLITPSMITFGHRYGSKETSNDWRVNSELYCKINTNPNSDLKLRFISSDSNNFRILNLHDLIMSENFEISKKAQIQADNINFLRNKKFGLEEYLGLPYKKK